MKKILLTLVLIFSLIFASAQKMDKVYYIDSVEYIADVNHAQPVGKAIKAEIIFQKNLNVSLKIKDSTILFILEGPAGSGRDEEGNVILSSYTGHILGMPYILATRRDDGELYSVGFSNYQNLYIYYIKQPIKSL